MRMNSFAKPNTIYTSDDGSIICAGLDLDTALSWKLSKVELRCSLFNYRDVFPLQMGQ